MVGRSKCKERGVDQAPGALLDKDVPQCAESSQVSVRTAVTRDPGPTGTGTVAELSASVDQADCQKHSDRIHAAGPGFRDSDVSAGCVDIFAYAVQVCLRLLKCAPYCFQELFYMSIVCISGMAYLYYCSFISLKKFEFQTLTVLEQKNFKAYLVKLLDGSVIIYILNQNMTSVFNFREVCGKSI